MTTHAIRRFVDLIGHERLIHGSRMSERGIDTGRLHGPFLCGKEDFIMANLSDEAAINPYLHDSNLYHAYRSGRGIEHADLMDVVRRCRP